MSEMISIQNLAGKTGLHLSHQGTPLFPALPEHYVNKKYVDESFFIGCAVELGEDPNDLPFCTLIDPLAFLSGDTRILNAHLAGESPKTGNCVIARKIPGFPVLLGYRFSPAFSHVFHTESEIHLSPYNNYRTAEIGIITTQPPVLNYDADVLTCSLHNAVEDESYAAYGIGMLRLAIQKRADFVPHGKKKYKAAIQIPNRNISFTVYLDS